MTKSTEQYICERKDSTESIISVYCRKNHGCTELCDECRKLRDYTFERIDACRNNGSRTRCKGCPTYCFDSDMDEKMSKVLDSCRLTIMLHPRKYRRIYL